MLVEVDDVTVGGGGGATAPAESIVPPNAETESANVRNPTAHVRRKLFTFCTSQKDAKIFVITLDDERLFLQGLGDCVKLTAQLGDSFSLHSK